MSKVLVAIPYRRGTHPYFIERAKDLAHDIQGHETEVVMWENIAPDCKGKYGKNAWARNQMIKRYLNDHDFVFWPDVDIVDYPQDILDLVGLDEKRIAAPVTYVEKIPNGGWFYDIGGFTQNGYQWIDRYAGIENAGNDDYVKMDSVGCNAIIPAWLYGRGLRYNPIGDEVEHLSVCRDAHEKFNVESYAAVNVRCYHALLPLYGEGWH